jgi:WhiB family redox-sensing transcriptional regulator
MTYRRQIENPYSYLQEQINKNDDIPCRDLPDVFFPEDYPELQIRRQAIRTAKALCSQCPVIADCLFYAITTKERYGIWGGTTPSER